MRGVSLERPGRRGRVVGRSRCTGVVVMQSIQPPVADSSTYQSQFERGGAASLHERDLSRMTSLARDKHVPPRSRIVPNLALEPRAWRVAAKPAQAQGADHGVLASFSG